MQVTPRTPRFKRSDLTNAGAARRVFTNDVHVLLHNLGQQAADDGDRAAAVRLLEVKEIIESSPGGPTATQADALEEAAATAAEAAGLPAGGCT